MPRFVVLEHDSPGGLHWDVLLEHGVGLVTWSLPHPPDVPRAMVAKKLPDHRLAYLDYEGPVAGDRGSVTRWDRGTFRFDRHTAETVVVELVGKKLVGTATLVPVEVGSDSWRFSFEASRSGRGD